MPGRPHILFAVTAPITCTFYRGMLRYLGDRGFLTTLVSGPGQQLEEVAGSQNAKSVAIPMEREIRPLADLASLWKFYCTIKSIRPQLIDASTPKAALLGLVSAKLARVPCRIYTLRGLRLETAQGWKRRILWLMERIASACSTRVVCISPSLRERAIQLRLLSAEKSTVLGSGSRGVDCERFTPRHKSSEKVAELRQEFGLTGNELVIGFVGRFVKDKGIRELVEAFLELSASRPNLRLLLVGDFEEGDAVEPEIRRDIENTSSILRTGFVSDTAPYYALMDVLALPTYREGFPGVPLEAQASEVPVVTTTATGAVDSVVDGVTGLLVPVGDTKALCSALERLLRNPELRIDMGHTGRKRMLRDFRPEAMWQAHADLCREILQENTDTTREGNRLKRAFDVVVSAATLLLLSPVMLVIAVLVRFLLGSPVLFRQTRPGHKAEPFTCLKFRTMNEKRDSMGELLPDSERLTAFGKFLRSTSLDELPELLNVLAGEMSLIGPRPLLMRYIPRYSEEQMRRHEVKPGITGWAQVNGRNTLGWDEKFRFDVWYVDHRSFWLDLKIMGLTVWKIVAREGISQPGHVTMEEFLG